MTIEQSFEDQHRVKIFKALSDETRLNIVRKLFKNRKELSCGEIGENLNINKSTVSYHFRTLREAGLTCTRKEGQIKYVKLNMNTFNKYLPNFLETL